MKAVASSGGTERSGILLGTATRSKKNVNAFNNNFKKHTDYHHGGYIDPNCHGFFVDLYDFFAGLGWLKLIPSGITPSFFRYPRPNA